MGRRLNRLTTLAVKQMKRAGYWPDGGGLYLQVSPTRTKSWIFRFTIRGKSREMGLGSANTFGLAKARERAQAARELVADGVDPISARRAARAQVALAQAKSVTFAQCAERYIQANKAGWTNTKHADQWTNTLKAYAYPIIGALPVADVDTGLVMKVIGSIWTKKPETASRLRGRIEKVLSWATTMKYREGSNPAKWEGNIENLLPKRSKVVNVEHHAALHYEQLPDFMEKLRIQEGTAARCLEFVVLTACRTGEAIGARPDEFNIEAALWTVPPSRTKTKKEHVVPLSGRAVQIVRKQLEGGGKFVFPGLKDGAPLSGMAMLMTLRRMKRDDLTVHGFRSSFKDWCAECTPYPNMVSEKALGHAVGDKVEEAYRRGHLVSKRVNLMADWARFCATTTVGKVVSLRRRKAS